MMTHRYGKKRRYDKKGTQRKMPNFLNTFFCKSYIKLNKNKFNIRKNGYEM